MFSFLKRRYKIIILVTILTFAGFYSYQYFFLSSSTKKAVTSKVRRGLLEETLTISGTVDAQEKATLRFQTSGRLNWIGVQEGDYVKKFQSVASLDQRDVKANLSKYLNTYMSERWDFEQTKDDYKGQGVTDAIQRILDKTQFDLNNTVIDVELKNLAIEYANLWTPIEGIVTKVGAPYAGVNVTSAQSEIEVVNPKTVYFSALADQTEVTKLTDGMTGELTLDAYPDATLSGSIKNIAFNPKSGETGTVYAVKFFFLDDNSAYKYRIGMAGDLTFVTKSKNGVLFIPTKLIKNDNGKKYVNVKINDKIEKKYIDIDLETDTDTEIVSGLSEGETIYE